MCSACCINLRTTVLCSGANRFAGSWQHHLHLQVTRAALDSAALATTFDDCKLASSIMMLVFVTGPPAAPLLECAQPVLVLMVPASGRTATAASAEQQRLKWADPCPSAMHLASEYKYEYVIFQSLCHWGPLGPLASKKGGCGAGGKDTRSIFEKKHDFTPVDRLPCYKGASLVARNICDTTNQL